MLFTSENEGKVEIILMKADGMNFKKHIYGKAREFVDEFIDTLRGEGIFYSMGVNPAKTYLLEGKPGTGKTLAVKVLNNELNYEAFKRYLSDKKNDKKISPTDYIPVLFFEYNVGRYGTAYINRTSRRIQYFFDALGTFAKCGKKTVAVLDEVDSIMPARTSIRSSTMEDRKGLETLMTNLQIAHDTENMYVIMMTNFPELCDEASLRAGRVDKRIVFDLPCEEERRATLEGTIERINSNAGYKVVRRYNLDELVKLTEGFSYADIVQAVENAVKTRALEITKTRTKKIIPAGYITQKRLVNEITKHAERFYPKKRRIGFI